MVDEKRDTVVVRDDRTSNPIGWIIGVVVLVILALLFFSNGGFGLFGGGNTSTGDSVNVQTPDTVKVEPSTTGQ